MARPSPISPSPPPPYRSFCFSFGSLHLPAAKVFPYAYLIPSFVIVIEALLGHGWTTGIVAIGAVISVVGLAILPVAPDG